jgi:hypothetical protein
MPLRSLLVLPLAIALCVPATPAARAAPAIEGIAGTVREADGTPAAGVEVWLIRTWQEPRTDPVRTDAAGRYVAPAPPGDYITGIFSATGTQRPPGGYQHAVRRQVWSERVTILPGRLTPIDMVMPDASATGACWMTGCTIDVQAAGFTPGDILSVTLTADLMVDDHSFAQRLATLTAASDGTARGTFVVDGLARAAYGISVGNTPLDAQRPETKGAETAKTLLVGPRPCTDPPCSWSAYAGRLSGAATLTLPAAGRAIASFTAKAPARGAKVGARITAGPGCGSDAELIATFPGWTASAAGERAQRLAIRGAPLERLRAIERDGTPLWFRLSVGKRWSCVRLWRRD